MPRVTISVPAAKPQPYRFALDRASVSLGRAGENDIVVDCSSVSGNHAVMNRIAGGYELCDLGSTNGTKLDGTPCERILLTSGMSVMLGDVSFDFTLADEELEVLAREEPAALPTAADPPAAAAGPTRPRTRAPLPQRPLATAKPSGGATGFFTLLAILVLAAAAFFIGMSLRYSRDNGGASLIKAMGKAAPEDAAAE